MAERLTGGRPDRQPRRRTRETAQVNVPLEVELTPEQRTREFFEQDVTKLADAIKGRLIVSVDDQKMVRIDECQGWPASSVGDRYTTQKNNLHLRDLPVGTMGVWRLPVRRMSQALISAKSGEEMGACVRFLRASSYDPDTKEFTKMPNEGDIVKYLGLEDNEAVRLKFIDTTGILYFNRAEGANRPEAQAKP